MWGFANEISWQDAVDVEVVIKGDEMDIGVFGSKRRMGDTGGWDVIDGVVQILRDI